MKIWVDADACPGVIKEIIFRAAERAAVTTTLIANTLLNTPPSPYIRALQVQHGFDVADNEIVQRLQPGDLVITADIPLASEVLAKGGHALNPRGQVYTKDTIEALLTLRNFMDQMRSSGVNTGGPAPLSHSDRKAFANQLDKFLARHRQS
ncbi:MAG: YaiI/YqxD family protein [Betaproteobacteria bacterium]|nr:YaiI/YqxD family protein [Betaproteobacteria bacterium]